MATDRPDDPCCLCRRRDRLSYHTSLAWTWEGLPRDRCERSLYTHLCEECRGELQRAVNRAIERVFLERGR